MPDLTDIVKYRDASYNLGRAVDPATYSPAHTAGDPVPDSFSKDNGGKLVHVANTALVNQADLVRTADNVASTPTGDVIMIEGVAYPVKRAVIDCATSGDNTIVAAVASRKLRVISVFLVTAGAVTVRFESATGGTALTGQMNFASNGGMVLNENKTGWFQTIAGELLNLELSGAVSVDGALTYIEIP